jgi:divalent metal cation (Fe/Co/Zn/Cd) transporter
LVALSFVALAGYVGVHSIYALLSGAEVETSPVGIGLAVASLVIMPALSLAKRRTGRELGSRAVVADSMQTLLCTYLSAVLLAGLLANSLLGWDWADPIAALVVAGLAIKEGREAWQGDTCACD